MTIGEEEETKESVDNNWEVEDDVIIVFLLEPVLKASFVHTQRDTLGCAQFGSPPNKVHYMLYVL